MPLTAWASATRAEGEHPGGGGGALDQVYDHLRAIAAKRLCRSGGFATLSPTELIHEALLGVMASPREFENRVHFFATMSLEPSWGSGERTAGSSPCWPSRRPSSSSNGSTPAAAGSCT